MQLQRSSIDHADLHKEDGSLIRIVSSTCRDFVYFRNILRASRKPDDNINHLINKIDLNDDYACHTLHDKMRRLHDERTNALNFCIASLQDNVAKEESDTNGKIYQKEVRYNYNYNCITITFSDRSTGI